MFRVRSLLSPTFLFKKKKSIFKQQISYKTKSAIKPIVKDQQVKGQKWWKGSLDLFSWKTFTAVINQIFL